jgi:hypothetical protein
MTRDKSFKRRVRERMSGTGESYAAARSQLARKRDRLHTPDPAPADPAPADRPTDDKVVAATGRTWDAWFAILDRWGARDRPHGETAAHLVERHAVPGWWAQSVTVWYERSRGLRLKHQQANGFSVSASKTVAVPVQVLFEAFVDPRRRRHWLADPMSKRTAQPGRTARFDWGDGSSRVMVTFVDKGPEKATVTVTHERLPDPDGAEEAKLAWRRRLVDLRAYLEA